MKEKSIERALCAAVRKSGGLAMKLVSPGFNGVPDRLLLLPQGKVAFVELKAPGKKPTPQQLLRHSQLRSLGFEVYVVDYKEQIGGVLREICSP